MDSKKISECMKRNMEKNNITAAILSEKTGLPLSRIEEYMSGDFVPKSSELKLIADAIFVPLVALVHGGGGVETLMKDKNGKTVCRWDDY